MKRSHKNIMAIFLNLTVLLILLMPVCSSAEQYDHPLTPEEVVQKFCQLDADGMRLSGDTWRQRILPLVTWTEEAGGMIFVIDSYKVGKAKVNGDKATVPVDYVTIGSTDYIQFSNPSPKWVNPYSYHLVKKNGAWKIDGPLSAPHVHLKITIDSLRRLQKEEPSRKSALEAIIQKINVARKQLNKNKHKPTKRVE
jgi:hypothetical protein